MKRISSKLTVFHKRILPAICFGLLAATPALTFAVLRFSGKMISPIIFAPPAILGGVALIVMRRMLFELLDEVFEEGDTLVLRRGETTEVLALTNIVSVDYAPRPFPARVELHLREASPAFGKRLLFLPTPEGFATDTLVDELTERIERVRPDGRRG